MKATELVQACENIAKNYKTTYMWGVFGSQVTESIIQQKTKQYPSYYTPAKQRELRAMIGKGVRAFDCVNMIKAVLWGWNGNKNATYGGAKYASNGVPDINADTFFSKCTGQSTNFSNIKVGEAVWMPGHIGIYAGNGLVVECTPSWKNGVQITACGNIGSKAGYNTRRWIKHGKIPYIDYEESKYPKWVYFKNDGWYFYKSDKAGDYYKAPANCLLKITDKGKTYLIDDKGKLLTDRVIDKDGVVRYA